ncbi:hypothetical protein [Actinoplanes awajinensis]|uniref:hypothetical protein n=1 Tax=Actinoplanes awajinensis TaxID=135946 RepID=UPI0018DCABEF|nr:hypothetical protein [Actinoplanes awajinensis]
MIIRGNKTEVELDGVELTDYSNNSQLEFSADSHDVTTYGNDSHVFSGGLLNGNATISGFYDSTAVTGPRAVIKPLVGTVVEFVHRPEGTGTGKPQDVVQALVTKYTQTHPVADIVTWAVDLQFSGDVDSDPQAS